jgi:hypothetical protein
MRRFVLALSLVAALAASAAAQATPDCEASTLDGEPLALFIDAPLPGATSSSYEPSCPPAIEVRGLAAVGPRFFDFYLTLDSSGSTGQCTGTDIDGDGEVGINQFFLGCSDPGDSILAAEVRAFRDFVDELDPDRSRAAVIQFSNPEGELGFVARQRIVQELTGDFALVHLALDEIEAAGAAGATDYAGGLELMREELGLHGDPVNRRQVGYFVSDGVPTYPQMPFNAEDPPDSQSAIDAADAAAIQGLTVNSFGVGFTPSMTQDPVFPSRCQVPGGGGGPAFIASTLECISLRTGGEFFASNDPADILEQLKLTRPAGVESVTVLNENLGVSAEAILAPDGGWRVDELPVELNEINYLRVLAVATDGTECEALTDYLPLCFPPGCDPRTQGYWHRQCSGLGLIGKPGGDPGSHPGWEDDVLRRLFENLTDPLVAALGSEDDTTTCEGLDADPRNDKCQKAIKQYTALILNIHGGFLGPDCELDLSPFGPGLPTDPAGAAELVAQLIQAGLAGDPRACDLAHAIADWINTGRALR